MRSIAFIAALALLAATCPIQAQQPQAGGKPSQVNASSAASLRSGDDHNQEPGDPASKAKEAEKPQGSSGVVTTCDWTQ
jgi:hypothetical protein